MKAWLTEFFSSNFQIDLTGRPVEMWLIAIGAAFGTFFLLKLILGLVTRRLDKIAERTSTKIDDGLVAMLRKTKWWLLFLIAIYVGALFVELPDRGRTVLQSFVVIAGLIQLGIWAGPWCRRDPCAWHAKNAGLHLGCDAALCACQPG